MPDYRVSGRQLAWMVAAFIVAPCIINMPQFMARLAIMDAWITQLLPVVYGFAVSYVLYQLAKAYPGKNFFEINLLIGGKIVGGMINILFLLHIWFVLARNTTLFVAFVKTNLLLRTPYEISLFLLIIVLIYYGKTSLEVSARVNDMFFPVLALTILTIPLLLSNDINIYQMQPIMTEPALDLGFANALASSWYADVSIFAAFLPAISNPKTLYTSLRHGLTLAAVLITWVVLSGVCVLGPTLMARQNYPTYTLIQQIHITDFLDRVELFIFSVYFPTFIVSIAIAFLAFLIGFASYDKSRHHEFYSKTVGWFVLITLVFAFEGTTEVSNFANFAYPAFVLLVQPIALLIILLLLFRKKRKGRTLQQQQQSENHSMADNNTPTSAKQSFNKRRRITDLFIIIGIASAAVGLYIAKDIQWAGRLCAILYSLSIVLIYFTTRKEMKAADQS